MQLLFAPFASAVDVSFWHQVCLRCEIRDCNSGREDLTHDEHTQNPNSISTSSRAPRAAFRDNKELGPSHPYALCHQTRAHIHDTHAHGLNLLSRARPRFVMIRPQLSQKRLDEYKLDFTARPLHGYYLTGDSPDIPAQLCVDE